MTADSRLPVHLLAGFLGSGKTTVLRHLLRGDALADSAVLINEFGAVGIDHHLVGAIEGEPVLLGGGCVCCALRGDIATALRELHARAARGVMPPFSRVVIELTGLADPTPVMATVVSDLVLRHHFRPGQVITTVDSVNAEATLGRRPEAARQVAAADRLLLTKRDLSSAVAQASALALLRDLNPAAVVDAIEAGIVPPDLLLDPKLVDPVALAARWSEPAETVRHGRIASFVITFGETVNWADFSVWFSLLAHRHGSRILRMKGILRLRDSDKPVAVQAAQHLVHRPEHLPPEAAPSCSTLVFIVDDLDAALIRLSFEVMVRRAG